MQKNILTLLAATLISTAASAQWNTSGTNIYNTNSGNVGIGTSSPSMKLEVVGDGGSFPAVAQIRNDGTNAFYLYAYSDVAAAHTTLVMRRARGTFANPANVAAGDRIASLGANYYIDGVYNGGAAIEYFAASTPSSTSYPAYIIFGTTANGSTTRTERVRITDAGRVGIGTTSPSYPLHVVGTAAATTFVTTSDARFKTNIKKLDQSLDKISALQGYSYHFNSQAFPERKFPEGEKMGLLAQEVQRVFPDAVYKDSEGYLGVDYSSLIPPMLEAIKALRAEVNFTKDVVQSKVLSTRQDMESLEGQGFGLKQNYPNPSAHETSIEYKLPAGAQGTITIHNLGGKPVKTIATITGTGTVQINAADVKPGLYLYSLVVDGEVVATKRMIVE